MNQLLERGIVASKNLLRYAIDLANPNKDFLSYDELKRVERFAESILTEAGVYFTN
ncbi:hypothetical protein M0L20_23030 [Spirosoma sp. RP8]|uniref:Four helix bundle protein n=1 Tax=Spirosoma liriopis TaxID=2937440 RepID=A0ABT0HRF5_9BACT|nr:hypothetical protein [Spirosoma liriopis]MCK8494761.1 hypothetical protein [Spirosoma liriopis]